MGYNTVAVIFNDHTHQIKTDDDFGRRVAQAMHGWLDRDRDPMNTWFGSGQVVSQAHADYSQIVVVGRNTGKPLAECTDLDDYALTQLADALTRHGWVAKRPARR